jgi:pimeloyl-ACP methyl ester carboxylesterase
MSEQSTSGQVVSRDGTRIFYERVGSGPPLILVMGALCSRALGPSVKLAPLLASRFTVFSYDRRGRGLSGDTAPYQVMREIEDLEALIAEAGGSSFVFGHSSGAVLGLRAAASGLPIRKLAMYEAPLVVDRSRPPMQRDWEQIAEHIAGGRRNEALTVFLKSVGVPALLIAVMRWLPVWSKIRAVAHTLPYDGAITRELQRGEPLPDGVWANLTVPVFALDGGKSPTWMHNGMRALAGTLPNAQHRTLAGQTHEVSAKVLAPVLKEFFAAG